MDDVMSWLPSHPPNCYILSKIEGIKLIHVDRLIMKNI